jgi:hypothetical protein
VHVVFRFLLLRRRVSGCLGSFPVLALFFCAVSQRRIIVSTAAMTMGDVAEPMIR